VYERVPEPGAVGAGILLQPTGLAVLAELGLLGEILARGAEVGRLLSRTHRGRTLFDLRYARLARGLFGIGMHRGALFDALVTALRTAGAILRPGVEVCGLDAQRERTVLVAADGAPIAEHAFVLVADGARSRLRSGSGIRHRARPYPWGALWFVGADPEQRFAGTLSQVCRGTERMLGFLPTGVGAGSGATPLVSLFWSIRADRVEAWRAAGLEVWKDELLRFEPRADALLAQIREPEQVLVAGYVDVVMRRFHRGRVAYIGDAAHATSPQLGQGTNLALMDALALRDALAAEPELEPALARYAQVRRAHTRFYGLASRWLTPFFQSRLSALAPLRDLGFPLLGALAPFEAQMLRTLAGVKRGILRRSLALAPLVSALHRDAYTAASARTG
jgi:2-polyprenyl-6-methoxyphenol hydroxylase-like FAD-dependent oxidoreductase